MIKLKIYRITKLGNIIFHTIFQFPLSVNLIGMDLIEGAFSIVTIPLKIKIKIN